MFLYSTFIIHLELLANTIFHMTHITDLLVKYIYLIRKYKQKF